MPSHGSVVLEAALGAALGMGVVLAIMLGAYLVWDLVQQERAEREYERLTGRVKRQVTKHKGEK